MWESAAGAVIHCRGHQRADTPQAKGNWLADRTAKQAAARTCSNQAYSDACGVQPANRPSGPSLRQGRNHLRINCARNAWEDGWWKPSDGRRFHPSRLAFQLVTDFHQSIHLGKTTTCEILDRYFVTPRLTALCAHESLRCITCAKNNPAPKETVPPGIQLKGTPPFEYLEVDFTEVKPC